MKGKGIAKEPSTPTHVPSPIAPTPPSISRKLGRTGSEATKRRMLDNHQCIIMGTSDPEVCHVISFNSCARRETVSHLDMCLLNAAPIFGTEATENEILRKLFSSDVGCSDKAWNMLCLNRQLHFWWRQCLFAFKYIELDVAMSTPEVTVLVVQFHWLPKLAKGKTLTLDKESIQEFLGSTAGAQGGTRRVFGKSNHLVKTGDTFRINVPAEDAGKMKRALEVQWALLRIACLSGGAEALELDDDSDDPESYWGILAGGGNTFSIPGLDFDDSDDPDASDDPGDTDDPFVEQPDQEGSSPEPPQPDSSSSSSDDDDDNNQGTRNLPLRNPDLPLGNRDLPLGNRDLPLGNRNIPFRPNVPQSQRGRSLSPVKTQVASQAPAPGPVKKENQPPTPRR